MKKIMLAALLATAFGASNAATITFDNVPSGFISNGYAGLNWSNFAVEDFSGPTYAHSGYQNGTVSGVDVAFNSSAQPASISATSAAGFDLTSGFFSGAWNDGLQIQADAVFENGTTASKTFTANTTAPVDEFFGWTDVASVTFQSFGGTPNPAVNGSGTHFALDNLNTTAAVPEPTNVALLLAGLGLMGVVARRRKA